MDGENKLAWKQNYAAINEEARYADEKLFYQLKVYLEANRIRVHSDVAVEGKVFMLFLAQILRAKLSNDLRPFLDGYHLPLDKAMKKMEHVRIKTIPEGFKLLKAPTKQQKEIYATFGHDLLKDRKKVWGRPQKGRGCIL